MTTERGRLPWGLTVVCLLLLALLLGLGAWQVRRLAWKEDLIARAQAASSAAPVSVPDMRTAGRPCEGSPGRPRGPTPLIEDCAPQPIPRPVFDEFQPVTVGCGWPSPPTVDLRSVRDGVPGARKITVCQGYLVDLGFVADGVDWKPPRPPDPFAPIPRPVPPRTLLTEARTTPVPGPFAPPPSGDVFYARDNAAMAAALGHVGPLGKQVLFARESLYPAYPGLIAEPPPAAFSNNHLGYALTWFGLAIALVGFYLALLRRRLRKSAP